MENEYQRDRDLSQGRSEDVNLGGGYQGEPMMGQQPEKKGPIERAKEFMRKPDENERLQRDQDVTRGGPGSDVGAYDRDLGTTQGDISQRGEDVTRRDQDVTGSGWQGGTPSEDVTGSGWQGEGGTQRDMTDSSWQGGGEPLQGDVTRRDQDVTSGQGQRDVLERDRGQGQRDVLERDEGVRQRDVLERNEGMGREPLQSQQFDNQPEENYATGPSERSHGESFDLLRDRDEEARGASRRGRGDIEDVESGEQFSRPAGGMAGAPEGETYGRTARDVPGGTTENRPPEPGRRSDDLIDKAKDKLQDLFGQQDEPGPERR